MEASTLVDVKVAVATDDVVAFVAHGPVDHATIEVEVDSRKVVRCGLYPNLECSEHQQASEVVGDYFKGRFRIPAMVWVDGDGKELFRKLGYRRSEELVLDIKNALGKMPGARVSKKDYRMAADMLEAGLAAIASGKWREAAEKMLAVSKSGPELLRRTADENIAALKSKGNSDLEEAKALIAEKKLDEARTRLKTVADEFPAFDAGVQAAELLKTIGPGDRRSP